MKRSYQLLLQPYLFAQGSLRFCSTLCSQKYVLDRAYRHSGISPLIRSVHGFTNLQARARACGAHLIGLHGFVESYK